MEITTSDLSEPPVVPSIGDDQREDNKPPVVTSIGDDHREDNKPLVVTSIGDDHREDNKPPVVPSTGDEHHILNQGDNKTPVAATEGVELMEMTTSDNSEPLVAHSTVDDHQEKNPPLLPAIERIMDRKQEIGEEEGRKVLEISASTGKFWLEWEKLKSLLSSQLKQVLSQYPEVNMSIEDQRSRLGGETYEDLVNRLDEALCSFIEGPPFTLQRLCEIILDARNIYPKLPKLALALERILLVTSTLTISTDPYPPPITKKSEEVEKIEEPQPPSNSVHNGVEDLPTIKDEVMMEVEAADGNDKGNDDMQVDEASEVKSESTAPDSVPTTDVNPVVSSTDVKPVDSSTDVKPVDTECV